MALTGPTIYSDVERQLTTAEATLSLCVEQFTGEPLTPKRRAALARDLAGVVGAVEAVRLWLGKAPLKHCLIHAEYQDSCHNCYQRQYKGVKG